MKIYLLTLVGIISPLFISCSNDAEIAKNSLYQTQWNGTLPSAREYLKTLTPDQWQEITVRNTAKGILAGFYHFVPVWIWNKSIACIESR